MFSLVKNLGGLSMNIGSMNIGKHTMLVSTRPSLIANLSKTSKTKTKYTFTQLSRNYTSNSNSNSNINSNSSINNNRGFFSPLPATPLSLSLASPSFSRSLSPLYQFTQTAIFACKKYK